MNKIIFIHILYFLHIYIIIKCEKYVCIYRFFSILFLLQCSFTCVFVLTTSVQFLWELLTVVYITNANKI